MMFNDEFLDTYVEHQQGRFRPMHSGEEVHRLIVLGAPTTWVTERRLVAALGKLSSFVGIDRVESMVAP